MKKYALAVVVFISWFFLIGAAAFQVPEGEGWPPQTLLYNDALFLSRAIPFIIALAIGVGIYQARKAPGDSIQGDKVLRHDSGVIIAHWFNAVGLILALVSGGIILKWVDRPEEVRNVFVIHYLGAGLTLFAIFNHLTRHGVSGGTGLIPKRFSAIRDLIGELLGYLGLFGPDEAVLKIPWPKAIRQPIARYARALLGYKESNESKYLVTEKLLSYPPWSILIGIIVVTGLIKVLRYTYNIPKPLLVSMTALHDLTAVWIGVMLIIHLLPLGLVPANWPLLLSMFKTTVPLEYVKKRHPVWYKELLAKQEAEAPAEASEPSDPGPQAEPEGSTAG
jgi:cytochrome b subunit of formate dehydrogenase